jgi:hypothetical protein
MTTLEMMDCEGFCAQLPCHTLFNCHCCRGFFMQVHVFQILFHFLLPCTLSLWLGSVTRFFTPSCKFTLLMLSPAFLYLSDILLASTFLLICHGPPLTRLCRLCCSTALLLPPSCYLPPAACSLPASSCSLPASSHSLPACCPPQLAPCLLSLSA